MANRINHLSPGTINIKAQVGRTILGRKSLLITIFIIILLVVYCLLGMSYLKQRKEHQALTSQIAEVTQTLREIPKPPQDLEQRLAAAQTLLAAEQSSFPSKIDTTQVINTTLELAEACGVKAIPMATQPWSIETVGEHSYHVLRLTVAVEGSFSQLVTFVSQLEKGEYVTLVMENLSAAWSTEQTEEETIPVTGSLKLAIYTQSPSSD